MPGMFSELKKLDQKKFQPSQQEAVKTQPIAPSPTRLVPKRDAKSNCQLNAWITTEQDLLLTNVLYKLKAHGVKIKKGELLGVAIEVFSRILENQSPTTLDASILDSYIQTYGKR